MMGAGACFLEGGDAVSSSDSTPSRHPGRPSRTLYFQTYSTYTVSKCSAQNSTEMTLVLIQLNNV